MSTQIQKVFEIGRLYKKLKFNRSQGREKGIHYPPGKKKEKKLRITNMNETKKEEKEEKCKKVEHKKNQEKREEVLEVDPLLDITHIFNKQNSSVELQRTKSQRFGF